LRMYDKVPFLSGRSLPMTPGSNPNGSKMMFIPSKPFNNLFNHQQPSPLSTSAPPSSGPRGGVRVSPTSHSRTDITQPSNRPPLQTSNNTGFDVTLKSKIVSPYIVSVDNANSRQLCEDQSGPQSPRNYNSVESGQKTTRPQQTTRLRQQGPPLTPQARRPVSATARSGTKPHTQAQSGFKQQVSRDISLAT